MARYSDSKGYVYAREEGFWPHAWAYRDWVVQALNRDMPYDRILLLQLAADPVRSVKRSRPSARPVPPFPSPFSFRRYGQSGIEVSELFARTAAHIDDIAVIRSMYAQVPNHEPSLMLMNCGDSV